MSIVAVVAAAALAVPALVTASEEDPSSTYALPCDVVASVSGIPDPEAGHATAEEAMRAVSVWPAFEGVPEDTYLNATIVSDTASAPPPETGDSEELDETLEPDPGLLYSLAIGDTVVAFVSVAQFAELQPGAWYLVGFSACSPIAPEGVSGG